MMPYIRGYEEDGFVKQLEVTRQSLEIISPEKVFFPSMNYKFRYNFIFTDTCLAYQNKQNCIQATQKDLQV